ncbi:hypothetical protein [Anaeromyxobacter sp. PSR-1]|uniref:hypothetical protein n=1 Tax=unclassified Anaeromyxobacter TaxID=2620896 RepID=UPI0005E2F71D|nr:hypothetical protein [Anaeromyxobacter sp. PSR-1]GAO05204.1 hypothetical protein PSR1_04113 [Anaeromyxobacter sp. PSR-1]
MTARFLVLGPAAACLLAGLAACSAPGASVRASAVAAQGAEAEPEPAADVGRPRVELLAPCEDAARAGVPCPHRHPVLEVSF